LPLLNLLFYNLLQLLLLQQRTQSRDRRLLSYSSNLPSTALSKQCSRTGCELCRY
jgi:hypothetical protein